MERSFGAGRLILEMGDITDLDVDVIVNAANNQLRGGGGVDGAIHEAGGPEILEECTRIHAERGDLPTGRAVITTGGRLQARHVIHAVGPVWRGGDTGEDSKLASAYRESLALAVEHGLTSIAFPSISTGVFGFPTPRAARIALFTLISELPRSAPVREVRMVLFSAEDLKIYEHALLEQEAGS